MSASCVNALVGNLAPLLVAAQEEALPHLDVLWHYDCVVSPRSPAAAAAKAQYSTESPPSHAKTSEDNSPSSSRSPGLVQVEAAPLKGSSGIQEASYIMRGVVAQERQALQRVFNTFDENGDGKVSIQELGRVFESLGISKTQESIQSLLADNSTSHVDEDEFVLLYECACDLVDGEGSASDLLHADVDGDLRAAFHVFDMDRNGFISPAELQSVLCRLGFPQARELEACAQMIARVDENGDGQVDFFEFKKLFALEDPMTTNATTY